MGDAVLHTSVTDLCFIRPGSLNLTQRQPGEEPRWVSDEVRIIDVSLGISPDPLKVRVRRIEPGEGDATGRNWLDAHGNKRFTPLAPYALADPVLMARVIEDYLRTSCCCMPNAVERSHPVVQMVYSEVGDHLRALERLLEMGSPVQLQVNLMRSYVELWFGIRNTMGSSWISGTETLGMEPVDEPGYPLRGKISLPRQVVQEVSVLIAKALVPRERAFLVTFKDVLDSDDKNFFFVVFLLVFVLLHECEDINKDRERYARQNNMETKFSLPEFIERLHRSVQALSDHWLRFAAALGVDFSSLESFKATLGFLPASQRDFVAECYDLVVVQAKPQAMACEATWTQDLCFVTHMFGVPWQEDSLYRISS